MNVGGLVLPSGSTHGIIVAVADRSVTIVRYDTGLAQTVFQNGDLRLTGNCGTEAVAPFPTCVTTPRVFQGSIFYQRLN